MCTTQLQENWSQPEIENLSSCVAKGVPQSDPTVNWNSLFCLKIWRVLLLKVSKIAVIFFTSPTPCTIDGLQQAFAQKSHYVHQKWPANYAGPIDLASHKECAALMGIVNVLLTSSE